MTKQTQNFIRGTLILTLAGILAKVVSAFYKVPLRYLTGTVGLSHYNAVYPLYSILTAAALIGIPNSVSKLVAEELAKEEFNKAHQTFRIAFVMTFTMGVIVALTLFLGGQPIIEFYGWEGSYYALLGLSFAPLFIGVSGAVRGYLQGMQIMVPTAISQIIENVFKVILGLGLVVFLKNQGQPLEVQVGGAAMGVSLGLLLSAVFLLVIYLKKRKDIKEHIRQHDYKVTYSRKEIVKKIAYIAVPITVASASYSILLFVDSSTLPRILTQIIEVEGTTVSLGKYINGVFGIAQTIINVPLVISISLIISVVPSISAANVLEDKSELKAKIHEAIEMAIKLGLPAAAGIMVLAKPILNFVYRNPEGYEYLTVLGIVLFLMIVAQSMIGVLQGLSRYYTPFVIAIVAALVKTGINRVLIPTSLQGYGALIGTIGFYIVIVTLSFIMIQREVHVTFNIYHTLIKPLLASSIMGFVTYMGYNIIHSIVGSNIIATLTSVIIGMVVYAAAMVLLKAFTKDELMIVPKHEKIIKVLEKYNLIKE